MKFVQLYGAFYSVLNYSLVCSPLNIRTFQGIQTVRQTNENQVMCVVRKVFNNFCHHPTQ